MQERAGQDLESPILFDEADKDPDSGKYGHSYQVMLRVKCALGNNGRLLEKFIKGLKAENAKAAAEADQEEEQANAALENADVQEDTTDNEVWHDLFDDDSLGDTLHAVHSGSDGDDVPGGGGGSSGGGGDAVDSPGGADAGTSSGPAGKADSGGSKSGGDGD